MKYLLMYEYGGAGNAEAVVAAHVQHYADHHARGEVLLAGPWEDDSGALGVFLDRPDAERFVTTDPFVRESVVSAWTIRDWNEVLAEPRLQLRAGQVAGAVLFYEASARVGELAPLYLAAHRALYGAFHERGLLLMVGNLVGGAGGAIGVFSSADAAAEFAAADPFVLHGVVARSYARRWNEMLAAR